MPKLMKKIHVPNALLLVSFFLFSIFYFLPIRQASAQLQPDFKLGAFQVGEKLKYTARYGFIHAAEVTMEVQEAKKEINGKKPLHFVANGRTTPSFDWFMKVRHRYDSYVDQKELLPMQFTESVREGKYKRDSYANFDQKGNKIVASKGTFISGDVTFDILSMYYFARCLDLKEVKVGEVIKMKYFLDDGIYPLDIEYLGKETVETESGKFECIKFSPALQPGRVFKKDSRMYMWITNDLNRIPVKVEVEILIGSVVLELQKYQGLKNPITSFRN
jgi:hypothetical protein